MGAPLTIELPFVPRPHQRDAHTKRRRFTVLVWHRRAGKTVFVVIELLLAAIACTLPMGEFGLIAPKLKQAKKNAWKYLKHFARVIPGVVVNESELYIQLPHNGARVRLYGADDPDSIRGDYFDGVALDEVGQMKPEVWGEIVRPMLADRRGWAIFIGTPKGVNLFSETYYRALADTSGEWYADLRRWNDTGAIDPREIEQARREMTPAQFAQEFDCDFAAACENALIPLDSVKEAMQREVADEEFMFAPRILGVDVARTGGDRCAFFPRQGLVAFRPRAFRPTALVGAAVLMQVAGQIAKAIDSWKPHATFIDRGGIGHGVVDRLVELGYQVVGVDFGSKATNPENENKRAEMWRDMANWIEDGGALPNMHELVAELTAPTFTYANSRGRFELESKDDMKKRGLPSPDIADALALTFAQPVAIPDAASALFGEQRPRLHVDFNPFA